MWKKQGIFHQYFSNYYNNLLCYTDIDLKAKFILTSFPKTKMDVIAGWHLKIYYQPNNL